MCVLECVSVRVWLFGAFGLKKMRMRRVHIRTHKKTRARQLIIASVLCPPKGHKQICLLRLQNLWLCSRFLLYFFCRSVHFGFLLKFRWSAAAAAAVGE
jgi:hypothetical protein